MYKLSPIVLFVYNRPWHTKETVEALQKNELANESELFIYSDAPKNEEAKSKVQEVRDYIKTVDGFKKVTIIEREKNWGLANSIIDGVTKILNKYEKIIVLEDDLVTNPYFLKFMNESLVFYEKDNRIMSISGYTYPFNNPEYNTEDIFLFYRFSSWGWASWRNEWIKTNFKLNKKSEIFINKSLQKKFNLGGNDLYDMLKMQLIGEIDSWAIRFALSHCLNNAYALFPRKSLVKNIGHDNSGTHCGKSEVWNTEIDGDIKPVLFKSHLELNPRLVLSLQKKLNQSLLQKIKNKLRRILK